MPTMSFRVPVGLAEPMGDDLLRSSIAGGHDRTPTPTRCELSDQLLVLQRELDESGAVYVPWEVAGVGRVMTATGTLTFRDRPYPLLTELARGKLNQVRNQLAEWRDDGLADNPDLDVLMAQAHRHLNAAISAESDSAADQEASQALTTAFAAAAALIQAYQQQLFRVRRQKSPRLDTLLGCRLAHPPGPGLEDVYRLTFNSVRIPLDWGEMEPTEANYRWSDADAIVQWAIDRNLTISAGPLLDFAAGRIPPFARRLTRDLVAFKSLMCDYVETVVQRYRGKISQWLITSGGNYPTTLGISEEDRVKLTVIAADAIWQIDPNQQVLFGVASPWGEYLTESPQDYSPFVYADAVLRYGLPFSAIELEWLFGTAARGTYCRDLLEASRLLDFFALLGVPLNVTLAYPSSDRHDPFAADGQPRSAGFWGGFSPEHQADWTEAFATLAISKPMVSAVFWDHLSDTDPHRCPHGGLVSTTGAIKPAFDRLRSLRESYLK